MVLKQLNYIFNRRQKVEFILLFLVILLGSGLELVGVAAIMPLVEVVTKPDIIQSKIYYRRIYEFFDLKSETQFVIIFVVLLIFIYIIKNVFILCMNYCQYIFTYNNLRKTAMKMMRCYMSQSYLFHVSKNVAELQRNMNEDVRMLYTAILSAVQMLAELLTCLLLAIYLLIIDPSISIGVITILSLFTYVYLILAKNKSAKYGEEDRALTLDMNKWIRQSFEGIKEIKIANREELYIRRVDKTFEKECKITTKQRTINGAPKPIFEAVCISAMLLVVGIKINMGVSLSYFIPVLSTFVVATFRLLPSFGRLAGYINSITFNKPAIKNVYEDLLEIDMLQKNTKDKCNNNEGIPFHNNIKVDNITFSYPNTTSLIFNSASVEIKKNSIVAFIGKTGEGKSTLADIILGLLEPQKGHVYVDNNDIKDNEFGWHRLIGYIPQSIYLIDDTIRNNILFGIPDDEVKEEQIWNVLSSAQLIEFVNELPDGIDTVVGERGIRLSGGQRQRIGIARALYAEPEILILDEATSALDNDTENAVMEAIDGLKGTRTIIIIAHRLTTLKNCDEIYEVCSGKIIRREKSEVLDGILQ